MVQLQEVQEVLNEINSPTVGLHYIVGTEVQADEHTFTSNLHVGPRLMSPLFNIIISEHKDVQQDFPL